MQPEKNMFRNVGEFMRRFEIESMFHQRLNTWIIFGLFMLTCLVLYLIFHSHRVENFLLVLVEEYKEEESALKERDDGDDIL